jgi:hypothetical protein
MSKFIKNTLNKIGRTAMAVHCLPLLLLFMMMICSLPAHAEYSFQVVIPPGAGYANAVGINNAGKVTGAVSLPSFFSYTYDMKSGEYTNIGDEINVVDISNPGVIVGNDGIGHCAIRDKKGNITSFVPPSFTPASTYCQARGVNPNGKVSGFVIGEDGWFGFIYDTEHGTYEEFLPSPQTIAHAINAQGQNVGSVTLDEDEAYPGSPSGKYGYLRQTDGSVKYFAIDQSVPGQSRARGISESGLIAGFYLASDTGEFKSYVTTLSMGTEFENITLTADQMVYQKPCDPNLPDPPGDGYTLFTDMTASQVRNDGVVVGSCEDIWWNLTTGDFTFYGVGFIATPIE